MLIPLGEKKMAKKANGTCIECIETRVQMPAKIFPHLKVKCYLLMGPTLGFDTKQINSFLKSNLVFFTIKTRF
jgi:hypothetical protein